MKPPTVSCKAPDAADAPPKPVSAHLGYVRAHDSRRGTDTGPEGCARGKIRTCRRAGGDR
ncbi:hypothetical protein BD310DRAFT_936070 [Dichomitus squalens]|uniref:Uncharacterized protein n=1 Tax=Dichomitus squalens TaxID=114155 RepID=A0A4Q9PJX2_9APHY|nr:hypothetical protein BD310DRAFT_936070 [Dichomitus squalens]